MELTRRQLLCTLPAVPWTLSACGLEAHPTVPDLPFTQIDGSQHRLADLKGKVMVINFWATSCSTCVREMPEIVATHRKFEAQGLETLAVAMQYDPPAYVMSFARTRALPFRVVMDHTGELARSFGPVQLTPTTQALQSGNSDILAGASLNITPRLSLDTLVDYSDQYKRLERQSMGARYNPSSYRVINAAYRYQRESSEVVDMSWQWPLNDLWRDLGLDRQQGQGLGEGRLYSIGRFNYSLLEKRLVESMLGVEYDGGCWVSRFALQRTQLTLNTATTSLMFQLEFNDFSRLGFGNMNAARDNISRYQNLREPFRFAPSPFAQYD